MKKIAILLLTCLSLSLYGQTDADVISLDSAKTLFYAFERDENGGPSFPQIVSILENITRHEPHNTEAKYFLGYAYSRMNAYDGKGIPDMDLDLVVKSSAEFEKVIALTPKYTGERIILDPHSKIASEWGAMALCYMSHGKRDSALWAFNEGKTRGGFSPFFLNINRNILDACNENAILIVSGDNISFPLWYLQNVENYRTDVTLVERNLLHSNWYPTYLQSAGQLTFGAPEEALDTLDYIPWKDSTITIADFSWRLQPTFPGYLLRGDHLFMRMLKANKMKRDLFFTLGMGDDAKLSLMDYLKPLVYVEKLSPAGFTDLTVEEYSASFTKALQLAAYIDPNNNDEVHMWTILKYSLLTKVEDYLDRGEYKQAKQLMHVLDHAMDGKASPIMNDGIMDYERDLRQRLSAQ